MGPRGKGMIQDSNLRAAVDPLIDAKFGLGGHSCEKGFDCLSSLLEIYSNLGIKFPDEWKGYTPENYASKWKENEGQCRNDFAEWLRSLGEPIENWNFIRPGDLLLFEGAEFTTFPAVYIGGGHLLMVWPKKIGCKVAPLRTMRKYLREVRRLVP